MALGCTLVAGAVKAAVFPVVGLLAISMLRTPRTRWPLFALAATAIAVAVRAFPEAVLALVRAPLGATGAFESGPARTLRFRTR